MAACTGCGGKTNSNGNCFGSSCWNSNSKRHEDGRGGPAPTPTAPPNPAGKQK